MAQRPGFNIPNSVDVTYTDVAEPDSGDFSVLGNHRNGVVTGCEYSFASGTLTVTSSDNLVVRNGVPETVPAGASVSLTGTGPRFYLICWNGSALVPLAGDVDPDNPVFPDLPTDGEGTSYVALASVYVASDGNKVAVDKRLLLAPGLYGWTTSSNDFIQNRNSGGVNFAVKGDGAVRWGTVGAPSVYRDGTVLRVSSGLTVTQDLTVDEDLAATNGAFTGTVSASNLSRGSGTPSGGTPGDLYQRTTGELYFRANSGWEQVAPSPTPAGTIISNISSTTPDGGWLKLDGSEVPNAASLYPALWAVAPAAWKVTSSKLVLPDMTSRTLLGASAAAGTLGGSNSRTIGLNEMPTHKHFTGNSRIVTNDGGSAHTHTVTLNTAGNHSHSGVDGYTGGGFVFTDLAGRNKLDGYFNDSSHTASVSWGQVGISGGTTQAGNHTHGVSVTQHNGHTHSIPSDENRGLGQPLDTTPAHLTVYYYVKG